MLFPLTVGPNTQGDYCRIHALVFFFFVVFPVSVSLRLPWFVIEYPCCSLFFLLCQPRTDYQVMWCAL